jgi:menaquinone-dependent protoporphyrinogen oxidase
MKILIVFASTEGQTRKICAHALDHLTAQGHSVALVPADSAKDIRPESFDAVLLAASVHARKYQASLIDYATRHAATLNGKRTLFLSVSLAAAGTDPAEHADLDKIAGELAETTGWTPTRTEQVAGAFRFMEYDFLKYWAMRWIEKEKDPDVPPGTDREYTDWDALDKLLTDWAS